MRINSKLARARAGSVLVLVCLALPAVPGSSVPASWEDPLWASPAGEETLSPQRRGPSPPVRGVYKTRITPHWFQNDTRFWYRNDLHEGTKEFILVEAESGTRQPAFDHQQLALALSKAAGEIYEAERLPFSEIDFLDAS